MIAAKSPINNIYAIQNPSNAGSSSVKFNPAFTGLRFKPKKVENALSLESQTLLETFKTKYDFKHKKPISWAAKRFIDYSLAGIGTLISTPIILLAGLAVKCESKGPMFFKQRRIAKDGKPFIVYKLRTMCVDTPKYGYDVQDKKDPNITKVGKFLRKYSIDELPQFINILRGDMSLVGPRALPQHDAMTNHDKNAIRRYATMQGACLNYSSLKNENIPLKIQDEKYYMDNWSLKTDMKHLFKIARNVITGRNY